MATRGLLGIGQELGFEPLLGTVYVCVWGGAASSWSVERSPWFSAHIVTDAPIDDLVALGGFGELGPSPIS